MIRSYMDIIDRAEQGPKMDKKDWDLEQVVMTNQELVEQYDLSWDGARVITDDPDLADRVFQAGLELLERIGVYAISSRRVIELSRDEILEAASFASREVVMGEGKDQRVLKPRGIGDETPPLVWAGNPGVPTPEELFLPMVTSWMQEPIVDLVTCGSLVSVDGREVSTGHPTEIAATRRELRLLREGLRRTGRSGTGLLAAQSSVSELGDLAVAHPDYLRPCDAHLVAMFNELMIDNNNIARAMNSVEYGMRNASLATAMVGGLGGSPIGTAVVQTASFLAANIVCRADYHLLHPIDLHHVATSTKSVMFVQNIVQQAFARNAPCIIVSDVFPKSGALTQELLYEVAANAVVITLTGGHLEGSGSSDGKLPNGSGLEARLMGEVGHAVTRQGMELEEADNLVQTLLSRYEHIFSDGRDHAGLRFDQVYDMVTLQPKPEWMQLYEQTVADLRSLGLQL